eukprot:COSAG01_NODE_3860_length_5618_cov_2.958869_7_plen_107_part_00
MAALRASNYREEQQQQQQRAGQFEVFVDGGVQRGSDVFKCLALGADGVGVGRAALMGLAAYGQSGVRQPAPACVAAAAAPNPVPHGHSASTRTGAGEENGIDHHKK